MLNVNNIHKVCGYVNVNQLDSEELAIIARLKEYGITPTYNKAIDRSNLREAELREVKTFKSVSNKFLTVSNEEQEEIIAKLHKQNDENDSKVAVDSIMGQKLLGEQIYLAILMQ